MSDNKNYLSLIDGLKDLATPDSVILNAEDSLSELDIFKAAAIRIQKILPLTAYSFLIVDDDFDFQPYLYEPEDLADSIKTSLDYWIDSGIFSWALNQNRALIHKENGLEGTAIFHSITSGGHVAGMFVGFVKDENLINEGNLSLLSVALMNCGKSLEAFNLNAALKRHNENLEFLVQERTRELAFAKEIAEKDAYDKSAFLSTMSHEIRTPMNGVIGMAQILSNTTLNTDQRKYVDTITESGLALTNLINDILDFSKIEAGKLELDPTAFSLTELCKNTILLFSSQLKNKKIKLELAVPADEKHYIFGDHGRMRQILNNLVSNAVKFTQRGFVTIQIVHHDKGDTRHLYIAVIDSGIGIDPEAQKKLFKPFSQSGASIAHKHGGTGLGLSICKKLVELMGGKIGVTSQYGKGATFWIELAFDRASPELVDEALNEKSNIANDTPLSGKVLIVEDNETNQQVIQLMLTALGLTSIIANNGLEALDLLENHEIDLILMDCQMPVLNGFETTKRICDSYEKDKRPPIIALTANAFTSDVDKCLEAGMDDFMSKPIDQKTLTTMLAKWLPTAELNVTEASSSSQVEDALPAPTAETNEEDLSRDEYIDMEVVNRLLSLSPEAFQPIKASFLQNTEKRLGELQEAYSAQDSAQVQLISHSLKGSCATFGAKKMAHYAAQIEQAVKDDALDSINDNLKVLTASFQLTQTYLNEL